MALLVIRHSVKQFFLSSNTGWLLRSNYILRTTNGGATFDSTHTVFTYLWDIYFKDVNTGVLCGDGALTMRSTDGGVIWNQVQLPLFQGGMPNLYRISFAGNNGWVIGEGGPLNGGRLVWKTTNFGVSWDSIARVPYPGSELNYSVTFSNINTGYCGGTTGYIFKSTNGGFNWIQQNVPINGFRRDLWFLNDSLGWTVGGGGYILKTTNGGTYVGIEPISGIVPGDYKLYQNYPNPFNPITNIKFQIPISGYVQINVFDITGREIEKMVNGYLHAGVYNMKFEASKLTSGVYFYELLINGKPASTKKMVLIK
ncbi:MAG: Peptidase S8 and S53, subtilisin, kexin, sedolisin [Chlorobi bacterium OLB5]|nr:MAG: Peptidase S8 and S53, subtilisin, kexin, sedolisin [Chlorobi bacterium OLB5]